MIFLFKKLWGGLKGLAKLVFPVFAKARDLRHPGPRLTWALRLLVLASILVLLGSSITGPAWRASSAPRCRSSGGSGCRCSSC